MMETDASEMASALTAFVFLSMEARAAAAELTGLKPEDGYPEMIGSVRLATTVTPEKKCVTRAKMRTVRSGARSVTVSSARSAMRDTATGSTLSLLDMVSDRVTINQVCVSQDTSVQNPEIGSIFINASALQRINLI